MLLGPWRSGFLQFDHDHVIGSARRRHQPAIVDRMHGMAQCVLLRPCLVSKKVYTVPVTSNLRTHA